METLPSCPACRARFEKYHDAQGHAITHSPIGYVKLYIAPATQPVICRSYADVRAHILPLAEGTTLHIDLVAYMVVVGEGYYTRFGDGVAVSYEDGACEGLYLAMREAIPVESPPLQTP